MLTTLDWIVAAIITLFLILIVKKFSAAIKNAEDYYVASGSIPFSLLVGTLVATWYGGQGTLNSVEAGALSGMASWGIWCVGAHLSRIPLALYVAPQISVRTEMTIPQMLKKSYGKKIAFFIACYMSIQILDLGEVVAMRNFLSGVFGNESASFWVIIIMIGIVLLTCFGGLMGVAVTDMLLFWCMCTAVALAIPAMWGTVGGWTGLVNSLTQSMGKEQTDLLMNPIFGGDTLGVITLLVMSFSVYVEGGLYQRFRAADSPRNASRSYLTAFCVFICLDFLLTVAGLLVLALEPGSSNIAQSYVSLVCTHLPSGIRAIFFVGILGAMISTMDSYWLVGGMMIANDIIGNFKKLSDRQSILYGKIAICAIAVVSYFGASVFTQSLEATRFIQTMSMAVTFPVCLFGIFYKGKKSVFGGWCTIAVGTAVYFFLTFIRPASFNGMLVALPIAIATFFLTKNIGKTAEELEA